MTRRRLLSAAAVTGTGLVVRGENRARADQVPAATPVADEPMATPSTETMYLLQVDMPAWAFVLHSMQNPYLDKLTFPSEIPAGSHVVRADVSIINDSDQPLNFQASSIRLLDADGVEYAAGNAQGREPRLVSQALPEGQRSRGSVWFIVPDSAELVEIKFYGPTPQFRVRLDGE